MGEMMQREVGAMQYPAPEADARLDEASSANPVE